ncbi:MAG: FAD-binding oxidoreductase [Acidobacteria bacterium]|nr:FAD-binding oxidoreductase [Acidobacteriota bacterium]
MQKQSLNVQDLRERVRGEILLPGGAEYEGARKVWNAMIDRRPAVIVRCTATPDVVATVNFARDERLPLAVRGGGHNVAGAALCDDGVVLDLSRMKTVTVDAPARRASVQAGALLSDVDAATQAHGLAVPLGINSTTGVAGLTLGGGFGWTSRKLGMTVDNLESAEVVTAAGEVVRASATEHPDLFWALRGGGGNFGVVTRFDFRLHPLGPEVLSGLIVFPIAGARSVLQRYREFAASAPDELSAWIVMRKAPPLPFLPQDVHGKGILVVALCYAGPPAEGQRYADQLRRLGTPVGEHVGVQPYAGWQQAFDPLLAPGARNYWKSQNFTSLPDALFDTLLAQVEKLPGPECEIFIAALGGAMARAAADSTAYAQRDALFLMNVHGRWADPKDDARGIAWSREVFRAVAPFATGGVYVNFLTEDEGDRVRAAYGRNYGRLAQVKRAYDPANLFRVNFNVRPA